jgi:hypothetical protein
MGNVEDERRFPKCGLLKVASHRALEERNQL